MVKQVIRRTKRFKKTTWLKVIATPMLSVWVSKDEATRFNSVDEAQNAADEFKLNPEEYGFEAVED